MIKLVKNELIKIFKRKTIYLLLFFSTIAIIIYNNMNPEQNDISSYKSSTKNISINGMQQVLESIDKDNNDEYIVQMVSIDFWELYNSFEENSWQRYALKEEVSRYSIKSVYTDYNLDIQEYLKIINDYENNLKTEITIDNYNKAQEKYNKYVSKLNADSWKEFVNLKIQNLEERRNTDELLETEINEIDFEIEIYKLRLKNNINYDYNFLNQYLEEYKNNYYLTKLYDVNTYNESTAFISNTLNNCKVRMNLCKYAIEHNLNTDISNENGLIYSNKIDARISFIRTFKHFNLIIVIIAIYLSTTIVTEEVNKNTIKTLLIKPHKRRTILVSKIIACIVSIIITMIFVTFTQYLIGGIIFGFDSYRLNYIGYNLNTEQIVTMNLFEYVTIVGLLKLPMYILIIIFCIFIGVLNKHTSMSMILTLMIFIITSTVVAEYSKVESLSVITRYFVTNNWDFCTYMFGQVSAISGVTLIGSIINYLLHFSILIYSTIKYFNKKDIINN